MPNQIIKTIRLITIVGAAVFVQSSNAADYLVKDIDAYNDILEDLKAGDNVVLGNGVPQSIL